MTRKRNTDYSAGDFPTGTIVQCLSRKGPLGIVVGHTTGHQGAILFRVVKLGTDAAISFRGGELIRQRELVPTPGLVRSAQLWETTGGVLAY